MVKYAKGILGLIMLLNEIIFRLSNLLSSETLKAKVIKEKVTL